MNPTMHNDNPLLAALEHHQPMAMMGQNVFIPPRRPTVPILENRRTITRQRSAPLPAPIMPLPPIPQNSAPALTPMSTHLRVPQPAIVLPPQTSPIHAHRPIAQLARTPHYRQGRDRFPLPERRFHPRGIELLVRHEQLAGDFSDDCFQIRWAGIGHQIDDNVILLVEPERYHSNTRFRITTKPHAWITPVHRGDIIRFRGLDSPDVKYIVTWTINDNHDPHHCYVQVNALNKNQQCIHSDDVDWPALGFLIPKHMCQVPEMRQREIPEVRIIDYNNPSPSSPSLSDSSSPLRKRPRLDWKKSITNLRHIPDFVNLGRCGTRNTTDNVEMDFM